MYEIIILISVVTAGIAGIIITRNVLVLIKYMVRLKIDINHILPTWKQIIKNSMEN